MNKNLFQQKLLDWFAQNARDLPWRKTYLPYHIWISEIMLQQTRMDRVVEYFQRWIARFPDIESIVRASEDEILKLWEGLGYYSRAKNLVRAAVIIVQEHEGRMPQEHQALLALPGIGPYTAGAIMSLAFNREFPIVDGNVERVFARIFNLAKPVKEKESHRFIWQQAEALIPPGMAREFNQSLMELGALICTPKQPLCDRCPVSELCLAHEKNIVGERPVQGGGRKSTPLTMVAGILFSDGKVLIRKRPEGKVWGGLWEFPGGRLEKGEAKISGLKRTFYEKTGLTVGVVGKTGIIKHSYTVYRVTLYGYHCEVSGESSTRKNDGAEYKWVSIEDLNRYAFSAGHRKLIRTSLPFS
ncbi:MAG: A/G-specific adenine glycosylase [Proteobacteria bacterium]|nr:A/G-specific adenine glycosylase [Pseudomonadota bacterium]MBU1737902.1 A/G-specific adenine glycosylase [Pseudomonadota bacterium]